MAYAPFIRAGRSSELLVRRFQLGFANTASYDLPLDVFEPGEKRPVKAKKGKSGAKKGTAPNGSATPNGVHGGLASNPQATESSPTKAGAILSSKKRNLDPEVRLTLMADCPMRRPYVDYRMLSTRESSLHWQAIVISRLSTMNLSFAIC